MRRRFPSKKPTPGQHFCLSSATPALLEQVRAFLLLRNERQGMADNKTQCSLGDKPQEKSSHASDAADVSELLAWGDYYFFSGYMTFSEEVRSRNTSQSFHGLVLRHKRSINLPYYVSDDSFALGELNAS